MSHGPCPKANSPGCPEAERPLGCYSDTDHIVPRRYKRLGWLVRFYINTPDNKRQECRWDHELKNANAEVTESPDLIPDELTMLDAVTRAVESGYFRFNSRNQQRFETIRDAIELRASPQEGAA